MECELFGGRMTFVPDNALIVIASTGMGHFGNALGVGRFRIKSLAPKTINGNDFWRSTGFTDLCADFDDSGLPPNPRHSPPPTDRLKYC